MKPFFSLCLFLLATSVAVAGTSRQDTIKRSFSVEAGSTLRLDLDRGDITIEASSDGRLHVVMERDVEGASDEELKRLLEFHEYRMDKQFNNVIVESRFDGDDVSDRAWRNWKKHNRFRLEVTVLIPESIDVDFQTGAGQVTMERIVGRVDGRTGAGNVDLVDVTGPVSLETGAGNVRLDRIANWVDVSSGAGNITLERVAGAIEASTGAGDIIAYIIEQPVSGSSLDSGAGNVSVYLSDGIGLDVDAKSSVGSVSCDFGLRVRGKWMSKSCVGDINGGGPQLALTSGVGNVAVRRR